MRPLLRLAVLLAVLLGGLALPADGARGPVVISEVGVAPAGCVDRMQASTGDIAVRGRTVLASWTIGDDAATATALSRDGARTFSRRVVDVTSCAGGPLDYVVDPDIALGADGTPWVSMSGSPSLPATPTVRTGDEDGRVYVKVGASPAVSVIQGSGSERGFLETDPVDPSSALVLSELLLRGTVSAGPVVQGSFIPGVASSLVVSRTSDRGRTWSPTTLRTASPGHSVLALGLVRTGRALIAVSVDVDLSDPSTLNGILLGGTAPGKVAAQTSRDGGATWSAPVELGSAAQSTLGDAAAGGGTAAFAAPQPDGSLLVWSSRDAGRTWQRATAATGVLSPTTAVAVDKRGRIGVLSYAVTGDQLTAQVSTSRDGRSFASPVPVDRPFSLAANPGSGHVAPAGAYLGGAGAGGDLLFTYTQGVGGRTEVRLARVA